MQVVIDHLHSHAAQTAAVRDIAGKLGYIPPAEAERRHLDQMQPMDNIA